MQILTKKWLHFRRVFEKRAPVQKNCWDIRSFEIQPMKTPGNETNGLVFALRPALPFLRFYGAFFRWQWSKITPDLGASKPRTDVTRVDSLVPLMYNDPSQEPITRSLHLPYKPYETTFARDIGSLILILAPQRNAPLRSYKRFLVCYPGFILGLERAAGLFTWGWNVTKIYDLYSSVI